MVKFKDLQKGNTIFLVGSPDFIIHEDLVENFGLFTVKSTIETLDGKQNPITCISGEYFGITPDPSIKEVAYFTALSENEIKGHQASIRLDKWSDKFTKTISTNQTFLCFPDVASGLDYLEKKMKKYLEDINESREINNKAIQNKNG